MTIDLPASLKPVLATLGIDWPDSDEDKLNAMGDAWEGVGKSLLSLVDEADKHGQAVWGDNTGEAIDAFRRSWTGGEAPIKTLRDGANAAFLIAAGLHTAAKIVVGLKLKVIAELTSLAASIALAIRAAAASRGASLLIIPILRWAAKRAIEELINLALQELLSG